VKLTRWAPICVVCVVLTGLPAQALAQAAPAAPQPAKAVVVQQSAPAAQPAAPAKAAVVVQTGSAAAPTTPAPPAVPAAQPAAQPTPSLTLSVPPTANLGENSTLKAVLLDPAGAPLNGAAVDFASTAKFLNTNGSVLFAHSVTDAQGTATVDWQPRSEGSVTLSATFAGDKRFAGAKATATLQINSDRQLYQQQAGVTVPGLNAAPPISTMVAIAPIVSPLPRLSGWPLVVVLLVVWSLYARAVVGLFRIAGGRPPVATAGAES
jgi:hypothetical protein